MPLRIGTWNVQTMQSGLDKVYLLHCQIWKTAVIDRELSRLNLDTVALQETHIVGSGSLKEENYTFFWRGLNADQHRLYGVGFAICNSLVQSISTPMGISEQIMFLCLQTTKSNVNLFSTCAPTLDASPDVKDSFYEALADTARLMNIDELLFILEDFNTCVGN